MSVLNRPLLERLPRYYQIAKSHLAEGGGEALSSARIGERMGMDDTQVRKDLAAIGLRGCPRVGFNGPEIVRTVRRVLGFDRAYRAVIVGAGRLGGAVAAYDGFGEYGLELVALFDADPKTVGRSVAGMEILPVRLLGRIVAERKVELGILTVPEAAAAEMADALVEAGVRGIWNFTPVALVTPPAVAVRNESLSVGLAELTYRLSLSRGRGRASPA